MEPLEPRLALAAPVLPGNLGEVVASQYEPFGFTRPVGLQLSDVAVGGPLRIDVADPSTSVAAGTPTEVVPVNSGRIGASQFNGGGFATVGMQLEQARLGRGLTIHGFDIPEKGLGTTSSQVVDEPAQGRVNANLILSSQFNDGGFGTLSQRGRVGFQWRRVRVRGPVDVGLANLVFQPGVSDGDPERTQFPGVEAVRPLIGSPTNTGRIRHSQFNDGGFGDVGFQWANVTVGGRVATASNSLFIKPKQNNLGPLRFGNLDFGQDGSANGDESPRATNRSVPSAEPLETRAPAAVANPGAAIRERVTNDATNSGRILGAQVNDGGFGDVGLQWRRVKVRQGVTAAHNALTVQPLNVGQGVITVENVKFPAVPVPVPPAPRQPIHRIPADPPPVRDDGKPLGRKLPTPTDPFVPASPIMAGPGRSDSTISNAVPFVDAATNSGTIRGGQFNAGGLGDIGLQWLNVRVREGVELVHNSLSVHPLGAKLEGVNVSNVTYGPPLTTGAERNLAVLPRTVISRSSDLGGVTIRDGGGGDAEGPQNHRWLRNQQLAKPDGALVFLQWNGVGRPRGLVLVQNVIQVHGLGPDSGPITLEDLRFPGHVPSIQVEHDQAGRSAQTTGLGSAAHPMAIDSSNNSGILSHNQFNDGGAGSVALQWRDVQVAGRVAVVRNTLAVNLSTDPLLPGDVPGPISISNVSFNSGALDGGTRATPDPWVVVPPARYSRLPRHRPHRGLLLPHDPRVVDDASNSGLMTGGQYSAGGAGLGLLQWQGVKVPGRVTIVLNVLSIGLGDKATGPVNISHVTFR